MSPEKSVKSGPLWSWLKSKRKGSASFKYLILLLSLASLTWSGTYWGEGEVAAGGGVDWEDLNVLLVLVTGVLAICRDRKILWLSIFLAAVTMAAAWTSEVLQIHRLFLLSDVLFAAYFAYVAGVILFDIGKTDGVTTDTIIGAVCAYLLIGVTFGFLYSLVELNQPGSFSGPSGLGAGGSPLRHRDYANLIYYSFVTLSSVGYGDIVPVGRAARMISWTESVTGQFYMAILVARLVALHLAQRQKKKAVTESASGGSAETGKEKA